MDENALDIIVSESTAVTRTAIEDCETFDDYLFAEISITIDNEGNLTDASLCGYPISDFFGMDWTGVITHQEDNLLLYEFTTPSTGDTLFSGGLVYDTVPPTNAFLFLHVNDGDLAAGVVTRGATELAEYTTMDMDGDWSGFGFDFDDEDNDSPWRFEPIDISFEAMEGGGPMDVSGIDPDGEPFSGDGGMNGPGGPEGGPSFGLYDGGFCVEEGPCINVMGFQSSDLSYFFGFAWAEDAPDNEWSILAVTK